MAKALQLVFEKCTHVLCKNIQTSFLNAVRCSSISLYHDKDPAPIFFEEHVQKILKALTGCDFNKVFHNIKIENSETKPRYKFFTDEDLEKYMKKSQMEANRLLQMPPVVKVRQEIDEVLSYDPLIRHKMQSKVVFTDVTYGISDRERLIVVREMDGSLRKAHWEERERMNQIYIPKPGRRLKTPKAFQDEYLVSLLDRQEYRFILDFACIQFDPDNPTFQRVAAEVYERIDLKSHYDALTSTRHFGPFCFYLAWNRKIDNLLIHFIHNKRLTMAADLVGLYNIIHCNAEPKEIASNSEHLPLIKKYVEEESSMRGNLVLALQMIEDGLQGSPDEQAYLEAIPEDAT